MPLANKLAFQFDERIKFRGASLFTFRAVHVTEADARHLSAQVRGGDLYEVRLAYERDRLLVYCDCAFFDEHGKCKHVWATVLEADKRGMLADAWDSKYLKLEDDFKLLEDSSPYHRNGRSRVLTPPPPSPPAWKEHLTAIQRGLEQTHPRPANWPKEFEILYVVDVPASKTSGVIVLDLVSRSRKKNGDWAVPKEFRVSPTHVGLLPDPADVEAITAMIGGLEYYYYSSHYSSMVSPSRKSLPQILALKLIPMVAATGRLAIRENAGGNLHAATWDAGEPWKLWLEVRQDDRDQWNITGSLRRGEERMELNEPLLIARERIAGDA